jgi:hypothetical protein
MDYNLGHVSQQLADTVRNLEFAVTILLLISAFFLWDALRRLKREYQADKRLQVNQNTMRLHVIALFNHTFFLFVAQIFIVASFIKTGPAWGDYLNIARIFMFGS